VLSLPLKNFTPSSELLTADQNGRNEFLISSGYRAEMIINGDTSFPGMTTHKGKDYAKAHQVKHRGCRKREDPRT